jgi:hypothetical protein
VKKIRDCDGDGLDIGLGQELVEIREYLRDVELRSQGVGEGGVPVAHGLESGGGMFEVMFNMPAPDPEADDADAYFRLHDG